MYPLTNNCFPTGSFVTCGADETVRIWNVDSSSSSSSKNDDCNASDSPVTSLHPRQNIYSHDLLKILYLGQNIEPLCEPIDSNEFLFYYDI